MKKKITAIAPMQAGKMLATLYALFCVILVPFMALVILASPKGKAPGAMVALIIMPLVYVVLGFVFGVISSAIYNLCARWIGGFEIEVEDKA